MNIATLLDLAASMDPDRRIVTDKNHDLTIAGLQAAAIALADRIERSAPGPVAFLATNSVAVPVAFYGCAYAGRAFSPLNYRADRSLLSHFLETVKPGLVLVDEPYRHAVGEILGADKILSLSVLELAPRAPADNLRVAPDSDIAAYVFTSGTSNLPKAVELRHENMFQYVINSVLPMSEPASGAGLATAPNYHIATIASVLSSTYAGRRLYFMENFSAAEWLEAVTRESVTSAFLVPTMLYRVVNEIERGAQVPACLENVSYGGAALPRETLLRAMKLMPNVGFTNAYGLTETSSTIAVLGPEDHKNALESTDPLLRDRLGSVGRPLPGVQIKIIDEEILVKGPQVTDGYVARAGAVDEEGWLHTGDRGRLDSDGYLYVLGRKDDMIIRGGENISPVEVEDVMREFDGVVDVAVVGVADDEWGQRIEAAIEIDRPMDLTVLDVFMRSRLPGFKCPDRVKIVSDLPRSDLGKLVRRDVVALLADSSI